MTMTDGLVVGYTMGGYEWQLPNVGTSAVASVQIAGTETMLMAHQKYTHPFLAHIDGLLYI
jgi:hypothetical protein